MTSRSMYRRLAVGAASALAAVSLSACSGDGNAPQDPEEVPDIRGDDDLTDPFTGAYDAEFAEDMSVYAGQEVTLSAEVAEVFSPQVFSITAPDGGEVEPALVVAEQAPDLLVEGDQVTVAATPIEGFDAESILGDDVEAADVEDWDDEVYLAAEIVETVTAG